MVHQLYIYTYIYINYTWRLLNLRWTRFLNVIRFNFIQFAVLSIHDTLRLGKRFLIFFNCDNYKLCIKCSRFLGKKHFYRLFKKNNLKNYTISSVYKFLKKSQIDVKNFTCINNTHIKIWWKLFIIAFSYSTIKNKFDWKLGFPKYFCFPLICGAFILILLKTTKIFFYF